MNNLLDFAKGKPLLKNRLIGSVSIMPGEKLQFNLTLLRNDVDTDFIMRNVSGMTPEMIERFCKMDISKQIEAERSRLLDC